MKNLFYVLFLLFYVSAFSQKSLNSYQYAIVSAKFDFLKKSDMYQTSSLTKFLLRKKGFDAFLSTDSLPKGIYENRCAILFVNILSSSGSFVTKNVVEFRDCNGVVVYTSKVGKSRKKEYKPAYHQAIREAFKDVKIQEYKKEPLLVGNLDSIAKASKKELLAKNSDSINGAGNQNETTLNAEPISNGYKLVNAIPKVVYTLLYTSTKDLFILKEKKGILYLKKSKWIAEFYENGELIQKVLKIKF